jgi:hypothetical protein
MKRFLTNSALCFAAVLVFFLLLELALAFFWPHKLKHRPYHETYDPVMGWVNKPFKDESVLFEFAPDRSFQVKQNSKGLRGPEAEYQKAPGMRRILFVGDSFFWGYGVENAEVLTEILQRKVGAQTEILNGGVTGYGTDQELLWLEKEGVKYQPDIVVLGLSFANDLDEISSSVSYHYPKPIFMLEDGRLILNNVPVPRTTETDRKAFADPPTLFGKVKKFLRYHTHSYNFITRRLNSRPEWRLLLINLGLAEEYTTAFPGIPLLKNDPRDVERILFGLLQEMKGTAEKAGAKFLLVLIPAKEQGEPGGTPYQGARKQAYDDNTYRSRRLREFARTAHIPVLDLLPLTRERHKRGEVLYWLDAKDHHWTPRGHQVAAEAIYDFLKQERWIP